MADPRFYRNGGPFTLAAVCAKAGITLPRNAPGEALIFDLAHLDGAGPWHLTVFSGTPVLSESFHRSRAGFCLVPAGATAGAPPGMTLLPCASVDQAFAAVADLFYPTGFLAAPQAATIDPTAKLGRELMLGLDVTIGPGAEIGDGTRIGAGSVIASGVTIGRGCLIGDDVMLAYAHIGDGVVIGADARIGQTLEKMDVRLGRVIIQDKVEIAAGVWIDRGLLGDTVIGDGSRLAAGVQVAHSVRIGRGCVLAARTGVAAGSAIADFAAPDSQDMAALP